VTEPAVYLPAYVYPPIPPLSPALRAAFRGMARWEGAYCAGLPWPEKTAFSRSLLAHPPRHVRVCRTNRTTTVRFRQPGREPADYVLHRPGPRSRMAVARLLHQAGNAQLYATRIESMDDDV
jgi:hypothetical protein